MGLFLFLGVSRGEHMTEIVAVHIFPRLWWAEFMLCSSMVAMNRLDEVMSIMINSNEVWIITTSHFK